ncbi:divergent polysaccharide deacetylase family protein [Pararhodospirillum photometricum]|uniref:divergent polysaccharide deacetylase family protein n=1 Tax=Pararhodospirillum photometricum TaxID=1084 RepID=UPI0002D33B99|nr:divergent polysaccharide deacetylase family protein [Pararhodospirillum photometricum]
MPWRTYARPFTGNASAPRIALIVTGLGMRTSATQAAIAQMPPDVTLAFSPYASNLPMWMGRARQMGHETLLEVPTEPVGFPTMDPGALGLITAVSELENRKRLESALASAGGYVGVLATHAGRYTDTPTALRPLLESLKARGLLYVHRGAPRAVNANADVAPPVNIATTVLDNPAFQRAIDERLAGLEDTARAQGFAIGTLSASPLALYRATRWLAGLDARGFALAPVSALVLTPDNGASR